jgi:hypothetical protein
MRALARFLKLGALLLLGEVLPPPLMTWWLWQALRTREAS